jgi:hypothetical protein
MGVLIHGPIEITNLEITNRLIKRNNNKCCSLMDTSRVNSL